jgi:hypothetical protein
MENDVGFDLDGYTWQFDTNRLARVLSPKMRKFPLKPDQLDNLDAYIDNTIPNEASGKRQITYGPYLVLRSLTTVLCLILVLKCRI